VVVEAARMFGMPPEEFTEDEVMDGESIFCGELEIIPLPSPGHSPDSVCYYLKQERFLICGDVIFEANTGRTDLAGGSGVELKASIGRLAELDIVALFPGHMRPVVGKEQVQANFEYIRRNIFPWI
jgi:glyoxylase-like metal-dependent hydrolase (beta-lactamase superfamily II)